MAVIFLFIDGVGLGDENEHNPWYIYETPGINQILNGKSLTHQAVGQYGHDTVLSALDATLGVSELPQSATGQATIFTGRNAPEAMGMHMNGLPNRELRAWVERDNLYTQFSQRKWSATFTNAYTTEFNKRAATQEGRISVSTAAILSSGSPLRYLPDLQRGEAVFHDLTRRTLKRFIPDMKEVTPELAAQHLWHISSVYDMVVHEFFLSDRAGHSQDPELVKWVIHHYDRFLAELVRVKKDEDTIVLVSDHGNSEDLRVPTHTYNEVPLLLIGDIEALFSLTHLSDLTHVKPLLHALVARKKESII
ncbi:alkaline phosphatase family protein [Hazenella sp. IB182357]|uniref:Alkaline phosphatase family protein n=1 Tax=Polycladospora coralii TaxID=2771432 RepID=A0A926NA09_9BACL|nr:alkaline phosphatase family protein [Polycladospora coralii]MBD1372548.1 alkaline phosphatase family protein [Polycladospora coralii]